MSFTRSPSHPRHYTSLLARSAGHAKHLLTTPLSFKRNLFHIVKSPQSPNLIYPHLVLALTTASHPPPALTASPKYVNSLTVSTSLHKLSYNTDSPVLLSLELQAKSHEDYEVTPLIPVHLQQIHLPRLIQKTDFHLRLNTLQM